MVNKIESSNKYKSGIYIIRNTVHDKVYVGSTINFAKRFSQHKRSLLKNTANRPLQNFTNKHGIDKLYMECLEICDKEDLVSREQTWMDHYNVGSQEKGFNVLRTAGETHSMSTEAREERRKRWTGTKLREGVKWTEAEKEEIGARAKESWSNSSPERREALKRQLAERWEDPATKAEMSDKIKETWKNAPTRGKKEIEVYLDGKLIDTIIGVGDTAKKYNVSPSSVGKACNGRQTRAGKYTMKFKKQ